MKIGWLALRAILGCAGFLFHPDVACDRVFQGEFHFVGENDCHWPLLQHANRSRFGQTIGSQLFALQRVDFVAKASESNLLTRPDESEGQAGGMRIFRAHLYNQTARNAMLNRPPIKKASGTMTATMASAVLAPCSLTIIIRLAKQGMNRVMVIMPTTA